MITREIKLAGDSERAEEIKGGRCRMEAKG
jgi:hypothetical protein